MFSELDPKLFDTIKTKKGYLARKNILSATATLLGEQGIEGLNISAICQKAQMPRTSFYNYFSNLEEVLEALVLDIIIGFEKEFEVLHTYPERGAERLAACIFHLYKRAVNDPNWGKLASQLLKITDEVEHRFKHRAREEVIAAIGNNFSLSNEDVEPYLDMITNTTFFYIHKLANKNAKLPLALRTVNLLLCAGGMQDEKARAICQTLIET